MLCDWFLSPCLQWGGVYCGVMLSVLLCVWAATWLLLWTTMPPTRLLGVYSRPGRWFWLKVLVFYIVVKLRRWVSHLPPIWIFFSFFTIQGIRPCRNKLILNMACSILFHDYQNSRNFNLKYRKCVLNIIDMKHVCKHFITLYISIPRMEGYSSSINIVN